MKVLDLFCGLGGFSQAFRDRGHFVVGVDIVPPADAGKWRLPPAQDRARVRSRIPYAISLGLCQSVERALGAP